MLQCLDAVLPIERKINFRKKKEYFKIYLNEIANTFVLKS